MIQKHKSSQRVIAAGLGSAATVLLVGLLHGGKLLRPVAALPAPPAVTTAPEKSADHTYSGTSRKGDLNAAIQAAVGQVPVPCCDRVFSWNLKGVSGQRGGIDGRNVITVTIEAHIE